jgi:hypothetical protein
MAQPYVPVENSQYTKNKNSQWMRPNNAQKVRVTSAHLYKFTLLSFIQSLNQRNPTIQTQTFPLRQILNHLR